MRKRLKKTAAVDSVSCGNFSMIPTCMMKPSPLLRSSRSCSSDMPSSIDGVRASSSSVKIHCASASARTWSGVLGGCRAAGCTLKGFDRWFEETEGMTTRPFVCERPWVA